MPPPCPLPSHGLIDAIGRSGDRLLRRHRNGFSVRANLRQHTIVSHVLAHIEDRFGVFARVHADAICALLGDLAGDLDLFEFDLIGKFIALARTRGLRSAHLREVGLRLFKGSIWCCQRDGGVREFVGGVVFDMVRARDVIRIGHSHGGDIAAIVFDGLYLEPVAVLRDVAAVLRHAVEIF